MPRLTPKMFPRDNVTDLLSRCYLSWQWMLESVQFERWARFIYKNLVQHNTKQLWVMLTMAGLQMLDRKWNSARLQPSWTQDRWSFWPPPMGTVCLWWASCCKQSNSNSLLSGAHTPMWPHAGEDQSKLKLSSAWDALGGIPPGTVSPFVSATGVSKTAATICSTSHTSVWTHQLHLREGNVSKPTIYMVSAQEFT